MHGIGRARESRFRPRARPTAAALAAAGLLAWPPGLASSAQAQPGGSPSIAYVTNNGTDTVSVIDSTAGPVTATIPLPAGSAPNSIAVTPSGTAAYVVDNLSGTVSVISTATGKVSTIALPGGNGEPVGVAVTPDGATAYVTNVNSGTVSVISTATNKVTATIQVGKNPEDVAVTPDQAPVARLAVTAAPARQATAFSAAGSTVRYGFIASYRWTFGDGTSRTTTTPRVAHAYAKPGCYTVILTETSSGGTSTTRVYTGQTVSRNGGPQARATITITIKPAWA